ncbi:MAG: hypothetical protein LC109_05690 [Bacteroidia bacterium]|nr:hypothetical protein [Bacteroidia bacterium]
MKNKINPISLFFKLSLILLVVINCHISFAQQDTSIHYTFKPSWQNGMEMVYLHKTTHLNTNERDAPIYMTIDSLYSVMNITHTDSNTWIVKITHYTKYDKVSKTAFLETVESMKNAPLLLEFDNAFNYLGLQNWEQWRDTLYKNLRKEFENKKISLKTYGDYRKIYEQQEEVEAVVVNYYLNMFSIMGRNVNLWYKAPVVCDIINPFKDREPISKAGDELFYTTTDKPNEIKHVFNAKTDEGDFQTLAEDYLNYLRSTSNSDVTIPPPRIIIAQDEYQGFDKVKNNLTEFRLETSVKINGAGTYLEYHLKLLNIREPK